MTNISRQIEKDTPEEFVADTIRVNLDKNKPDIEPEERPKVIDLFECIAQDHHSEQTTVIEDTSLESLYEYDIVHSDCGNRPLYDESKNEWYCPVCESNEKSIFDY